MNDQVQHIRKTERIWEVDPYAAVWAGVCLFVFAFSVFWHLVQSHKHEKEVIAYQQQIMSMKMAMNDEETIIKLAKLCTEAGRPWISWPVDYGPRPFKCHLTEAPIIVADERAAKKWRAMGGR